MFPEFKRVSKKEWLEKVTKDLKGKKSIDSFNWEFDGMEFTPFYHGDDINGGDDGEEKVYLCPTVTNGKTQNTWEIGERIIVSDYKAANQQALEVLQKGANALLFILNENPALDNLNILLNDIQLEWISTHFNIDVFDNFIKIIQSKKQNPAEINCSFPLNDISKLEDYTNQLPKGKFLSVNVINTENALTNAIKKGNELLENINEAGLDISKYHSQIQFSISVDDNYFGSIAKIRALKILWSQVLIAWGIVETLHCNVSTHIITETNDENYNKIKATTQAMSAVIGGADRLYIYPSDANQTENGTSFSRRISLNVHHLMEQESYLDRVIDPSAGSYFIEELTNRIAEKAWKGFVIGD
ncbi:MAG: methylmalonyl-CoA mutase family protein [Saprospiraceae bacterium]